MKRLSATFMTFLPQILMSGFMFPFDGMPRPAQIFAEIMPLTHFVRPVRGPRSVPRYLNGLTGGMENRL